MTRMVPAAENPKSVHISYMETKSHDFIRNLTLQIAYVSVIFIAVLCEAAEEDGVSEEYNATLVDSSEEEIGEWTGEVVNDTLTFMEALQEIQNLGYEDRKALHFCVANNGGLKQCLKPKGRRKKRWGWLSWLAPVVDVVKNVFLAKIEEYINAYQGNHTCYKDVGCFHPANRTALVIGGPKEPETIRTEIIFFPNRSSPGMKVNHTMWAEYYRDSKVDVAKPLFGITHGFTRDRNMTWMDILKDAFFAKVDCNVLIINWTDGAMFPDYATAAVNTPLPGVLLSLLLIEMMRSSNCSLMPDNMHLIGFSLGAHLLGFTARHFEMSTGLRIGRITGLDPAGPLFEDSNVSLSAADANFVDIIHTNAGKLKTSQLGLNESKGHVDFYPNGGSKQPECTNPLSFACSHNRAQALFIESVTSNCSFTSCYCEGGWKAYEKCKKSANISDFGEMGYHSINKTGRRDQYLKTNDNPPYCKGNE